MLLRATGRAVFFSGLAVIAGRAQGAPPPAAVYQAPTDPGELLKVDEPMRRFFGERVSRRDHSAAQLRKLIDAIFQPEGLHFVYDVEGAFDARECFRQRRGNCAGLAFLVVAVAREYGFPASFQNVNHAVRWDRFGDFIVSTDHINVRVETTDHIQVIDLRPDLIAGIGFADLQVISDNRACAQFYDAVGFFKLVHAQPAEALQFMVLATRTDPDGASAWANLGALKSHLGELAEARACFERSLRLDPRCASALDGFVSVLQRLGGPEDLRMAAKYERRAQAIRDRNPYYQQRLADRARRQGDWIAAEKIIRRAIALKKDEPQFYEEWVQVLCQLGRTDDADRAKVRLEKLRQRLAPTPVHVTP